MVKEYPKAIYLPNAIDPHIAKDADHEAKIRAQAETSAAEELPEREALLAEAEHLRVTVDGRWGISRLRAAIEAAKPSGKVE
jgi:hypothetical protein